MGVLLDGSGIGMSVAGNKVQDIRAGLVHDEITAHRRRNITIATCSAWGRIC